MQTQLNNSLLIFWHIRYIAFWVSNVGESQLHLLRIHLMVINNIFLLVLLTKTKTYIYIYIYIYIYKSKFEFNLSVN